MGFELKPVSTEIAFAKMQGAGNDYVYIPLLTPESQRRMPSDIPALARKVSERHFGIGSDGLVLILPSDKADFAMRMFNPDGSEAGMCGNASRCIGKLVYDQGYTEKTEITLETPSGIKHLTLHPGEDGLIESVTVDMGAPRMNAGDVPVKGESDKPFVKVPVQAGEYPLEITAVNMGNPHGVVFVNTLSDTLVKNRGPILETADIWPERANIEFAEVNNRKSINLRVWERGTGETMACGTGACAAVVAGVTLGLLDRDVDVHLPGGTLHISYDATSGHVFMTGPAAMVATGTYFYTPSDTNGL